MDYLKEFINKEENERPTLPEKLLREICLKLQELDKRLEGKKNG